MHIDWVVERDFIIGGVSGKCCHQLEFVLYDQSVIVIKLMILKLIITFMINGTVDFQGDETWQ